MFANEMDRHDIGVTKGRCCLCFLAEAAQAIGVVHAIRAENLQSNITPERDVASPVDLTHAARPKNGNYFVRTDF